MLRNWSNRSIASIFIWSSILVLLIFVLNLLCESYVFWGSNPIDFAVTGQVGDYIGGVIGTIISAAGFYFLYLTFNDQRTSFEKERLESKFFDLIKMHRENVSELSFDASKLKEDPDSLFIEDDTYEGKAVFKVIFNQFIICKNELLPFFKMDKMLTSEYDNQLSQHPYILSKNLNKKTFAMIDICYSIIFYGLSSEGLSILNNVLRKKYKDKFVDDILRFISLKPANDDLIFEKWKVVSNKNTRGKRNELVENIYNWRRTKRNLSNDSLREIVDGYHNRYIKYYGGHQFRLGHYYRHLYQTVKFINNQEGIAYPVKYDYVKVLRAQLSTYEQAVLFLNSLSKMGETWEVNPEVRKPFDSKNRHDFELITKYNLIKNLPGDSFYGIHFKEFYPLVEFESDESVKKRPKYQ